MYFFPFFPALLSGWLFPHFHLGLLPLLLLLHIFMKGLPVHDTVGDSNKISLELPAFQAEHSQLSQPPVP